MNVQQKYPTTADEFLRWNEGREGKREFVNGKVVEMMINVTRNHARIAFNLSLALGRRLDLRSYDVGNADFGVHTPDGVRYPDVYVDRKTLASKGTDLAASEPVLLIEILSPSSLGRDFVDKLDDYAGVASLQHYVIASCASQLVWLWTRDSDGHLIGPEEIGEGGTLDLPALDLSIELAEIYSNLDFSTRQ